jgi:hypothetical protein
LQLYCQQQKNSFLLEHKLLGLPKFSWQVKQRKYCSINSSPVQWVSEGTIFTRH